MCRCNSDGEVRITVRDEGQGFQGDTVPDPTSPENRLSTHGVMRKVHKYRALHSLTKRNKGENNVERNNEQLRREMGSDHGGVEWSRP